MPYENELERQALVRYTRRHQGTVPAVEPSVRPAGTTVDRRSEARHVDQSGEPLPMWGGYTADFSKANNGGYLGFL